MPELSIPEKTFDKSELMPELKVPTDFFIKNISTAIDIIGSSINRFFTNVIKIDFHNILCSIQILKKIIPGIMMMKLSLLKDASNNPMINNEELSK
jgi:hypothetical protein